MSKVIVMPASWKIFRDNEACTHFTDEELDEAIKKHKPIKIGRVVGCGVEEVEMWVEPNIPKLTIDNNGPYSLKADFKRRK